MQKFRCFTEIFQCFRHLFPNLFLASFLRPPSKCTLVNRDSVRWKEEEKWMRRLRIDQAVAMDETNKGKGHKDKQKREETSKALCLPKEKEEDFVDIPRVRLFFSLSFSLDYHASSKRAIASLRSAGTEIHHEYVCMYICNIHVCWMKGWIKEKKYLLRNMRASFANGCRTERLQRRGIASGNSVASDSRKDTDEISVIRNKSRI